MTAATVSTNRESPKIESAGEETGENILVGLRVERAFCAKPALRGNNLPSTALSTHRSNLTRMTHSQCWFPGSQGPLGCFALLTADGMLPHSQQVPNTLSPVYSFPEEWDEGTLQEF